MLLLMVTCNSLANYDTLFTPQSDIVDLYIYIIETRDNF